jgi:diguanylate cyclase (GGDEF)-like protein
MEDKKILIVDDTVSNLDILEDLLHEYIVLSSTNGQDALEAVQEEPIDLILLDIMMPDMDGYEVCQILKSDPQTSTIPIIFITAKDDEASIEKAYEVGGDDYVRKPFLPKELLARVKKELKLQDMMKELQLLASTDPMTKLFNRRYFSKVSQQIIHLAQRDGQDLSVIMLDIDKFKNINDTYGHDIGDSVIINLANQLLNTHRKSDISCRYGGEEFTILLPNTSIESAATVAETIRKNIENLKLDLQDKTLHFTVSIGVSSLNEGEEDLQKALKRADEALYKAKESGRNRVCVEQI